jgi:hypothetical protein
MIRGMWRIIFWLWMRMPGVQRRQHARIEKIIVGPYRIIVIRHDLTREVIATGLTLQQATDVECELITDETVLNFVREDDASRSPSTP